MPTDTTCQQCDQLFTALNKASALTAGLSALCDVRTAHPAIEMLVELLVVELESAKEAVGIA